MEEFVCEKLNQWGLSELIEKFRDEGIDKESFYCLKERHIEKLIPNMRQRTQFKKEFTLLKSPNQSDASSIGSLLTSSTLPQGQHPFTADETTSNSASSAEKSLSTTRISVGLLNIRSLTKKEFLVYKLILKENFDFLCLTETWQKENDFSHLTKASPDAYKFICQPRADGRGGGVAMLYRDNKIVSTVDVPTYESFESAVLQINLSVPTILATIYRPPTASQEFLNHLSSLLKILQSLSQNIILLGDFNIHMDRFWKTQTRELQDMLERFGMKQHVDLPTHQKGHILDLVCCSSVIPSDLKVSDLPNCDHKLISFNVAIPTYKQ